MTFVDKKATQSSLRGPWARGRSREAESDLLTSYFTGWELEEGSGDRRLTVLRLKAKPFPLYLSPNTPVASCDPTQGAGPNQGFAAVFDGTDDAIGIGGCSPGPPETTGYPMGWKWNQDWTTTGWFKKANAAAPADEAHTFGFQCGGTGETYHSWVHTDNTYHFAVYDAFGLLAETSTTATFADTNWHFAACRYNAALRRIRLRVDRGTVHSATFASSEPLTDNGVITLGSRKLNDKFFAGSLASHHWWQRELTNRELDLLQNGGTVLRYPFTALPGTAA